MKKIILLPVFVLLLSACNDFLDYNENSEYTKEQLFGTTWANGNFVNNIYSYLPGSFDDAGGALRSAGCDEAEYVWPNSIVHRYYDGSWSASRTIDDVWSKYYSAIRACNNYLENGVDYKWEQFQYTKDYIKMMRTYNNRKWEVKALRAYFYFELVKRYRNIPLITEVLTPEQANNQVPVSFDEIIDFIVKECDDAVIPNEIDTLKLPAIYDAAYDNQTGRVSKAFAYALKSRALLYAASPLNSEHSDEKWRKAAEAAKLVIDSASVWGLEIATSFLDLTGAANWSNKEMILCKRMGDLNYFEMNNYPIGIDGGNTGNCPTVNLAEAFDMKRGQKYDPKKPFSNKEYRFDATVLQHGGKTGYGLYADIKEGGANGLPKEGATKTGLYLNKFINTSISLTTVSTTSARHSMPLFRLSEMYMNYAEAMNELYGPEVIGEGTLDLTARAALQKLRTTQRTGVGPLAAEDYADRKSFARKLQKERMVEFAFEDHRFWDIRRWKIGDETTTIKRMRIYSTPEAPTVLIYEPYETNNRIWEDKMYWYPISQSELFKNSNLKQNSGW